MTSASREAVETQIDRLFRNGTLAALSDAQLLERYLSTRDEAAFEALVHLHGPMVLGLCRRMLRDPSDVDDAFQATFLVLVRKAPAIRDRGLLANWLYGVAYRVAVRARGNLLRRRERETSLAEIETPAMSAHDHPEDIPLALDQELNRLPSRYRVPLVLCYLKGLTHDQAAEELRCPVGTIRSRLARGRDLLKRRLTARGHAPSASFLGSALPAPAVPSSLVRATLEAAARFSAGQGLAAATAASTVETLAEGALSSMIGTRFKTVALSLLALTATAGAVVGVVFVSSHRTRSVPPTPPSVTQTRAIEEEKVALAPPRKIKPGDWVRIEVLEALPGRPISGIREVRPDGTISLGFYGDVQVAGLDRNQIKTKVVNQLRKLLTDEVLGLIELDPETGGPLFESGPKGEFVRRIKPVDSDRVFVDDSVDSYAPGPTDKRLTQIEENLDQINSQMAALLGRVGTKVRSGETGTVSDETTDYLLYLQGWERRERLGYRDLSAPALGKLLAAQLENLLATTRLAAVGKASPEEVAKARAEFDVSKRIIPEMVRGARERVKLAKPQMITDKAEEEYSKLETRLRVANARLAERKKLFESGKTSEQEVWDAIGDVDALSKVKKDEEEFSKEELKNAQLELELAEQLKSKYLDSPEDPAVKDEKPK